MLPTSMRTIEISQPGEADVLIMGERPPPELQPHELLVKVIAAGVNGPDLLQRRGHYPPPKGASDLLGLEVSGEVVSVGADVSRWQPGDEICALVNGGGYAEYVAIDANHCLPIPQNVSVEDAAGIPETYFTVWSNLFLNQPIKKDGILLIHGGAGGIGTTAIQLGKQMGMRIFATCSSQVNIDYCESLGAERGINYREEDFVEVMREAGGADLIQDIVGADYIARNIKAAAPDARIVQLAFRQGSKVEVDLMNVMLKRLTFTGSTLRSRPVAFKSLIAFDLEEKVWPMFANQKLKTLTHSVFKMDDVVEAHRLMEASGHKGKILLSMV